MRFEWLTNLLLRTRALLARRRLHRDLEDELQFHIASRADKLRGEGMSAPAARHAASHVFGNLTAWKETCRDMWTFPWIETILRDLRYAARSLRRSPGFSLVAMLTLAIGIGANTAIFSVFDAVVLHPLPYPEPSRLVYLAGTVQRENGIERRGISRPDYADWRDQSGSFDALAMYEDDTFTLYGADGPELLRGEYVGQPYFELLGVQPILGRTFHPEEDEVPQRDAVAVLSGGLWQRRFGGDPGIVGRAVRLNDRSYLVVGVMPEWFRGITDTAELWAPLHMEASAEQFQARSSRGPSVLGRLKADVALGPAQSEMDGIAKRLERTYPATNTGYGVSLTPLGEALSGDARGPLLVLQAAVGLVLLIACINVANLLLVRAEARRREIAVRTALGAGRLRVLLQLATESTLLAALGGATGLFLAATGVRLLIAASPVSFPRYLEPGLNPRVTLFAVALTSGIGLLLGLAPALHARRARLQEAVQQSARSIAGGRRGLRFRNVLVVAEIAFATLLLIGAGLLIRTMRELSAIEPGYDAANVLTMNVTLRRLADPPSPVAVREILNRIQQIPSVTSAAAGSDLPFGGSRATFYSVEGAPPSTAQNRPRIYYHLVTPSYFATLRIPLLAGRTFTTEDMRGGDAILVSQRVVDRFWRGQDPIGKRISMGTIVGVVPDLKYRGLPENPTADPDVYLPLRADQRDISIAVRTALDPTSIAATVRAAILETEPAAVIFDVALLADTVARRTRSRRFTGWLMSVFAAVALGLSIIGIYGVLAYAVSRRQQEIAVRMALGASRAGVMGMILRGGLWHIAIGITLGVAAATAGTQAIAALLYNVAPRDLATFTLSASILAAVAVVACVLPAWRASRIAPAAALRGD